MQNQVIPDEQAYKDLDGSLLNPDTIDKSTLSNKNRYFVVAIFGVLGLFLGLYGVISYNVNDEEFYILLVLGILFFAIGFAFVIDAAVYLLSWKSFLRSSYLTRCNVFCFCKIQKCYHRPGNIPYYHSYYTLQVCYVDLDGNKHTKKVKYIIAHNLQHKMQSLFSSEGNRTALYSECIVAYNKKGKIRLIF